MHDSWPSNFIEPTPIRYPLADTTSSAMHNLNVNLGNSLGPNASNMSAGAGSLLTVGFGGSGDGCSTPKTPEILNSLIAMSNPFESLRPAASAPRMGPNRTSHGGYSSSSQLLGGTDSSESTSSTPVGSPCGQGPPSVQHTCSQLIKEGLKLTIQSKRKHESIDGTITDDDNSSGPGGICATNLQFPGSSRSSRSQEELTPEDEERRRRRRERNKIAATKCRLKKRERTVNLVQESEILETQNHELKSQIREMENQRTQLIDMLTQHKPRCIRESTASGAQNNSASTMEYNEQTTANTTTTTAADLFNSLNNAAFYSNATFNYITTSASDSDGGCIA